MHDSRLAPLGLRDAETARSRAVPVPTLFAEHLSTHFLQSSPSLPMQMRLGVDAFGDCPLLSDNKKILTHPTNERTF